MSFRRSFSLVLYSLQFNSLGRHRKNIFAAAFCTHDQFGFFHFSHQFCCRGRRDSGYLHHVRSCKDRIEPKISEQFQHMIFCRCADCKTCQQAFKGLFFILKDCFLSFRGLFFIRKTCFVDGQSIIQVV